MRDLSDFQTPTAMRARLAQENVTIRPARQDEVDAVIAFEWEHFPGWAAGFVYMAELGDSQNMLVAVDADKGIVGTLMLHTPSSRWLTANVTWKTMLGDALGGISAVGVAAEERGRGIGIGMVRGWLRGLARARRRQLPHRLDEHCRLLRQARLHRVAQILDEHADTALSAVSGAQKHCGKLDSLRESIQ